MTNEDLTSLLPRCKGLQVGLCVEVYGVTSLPVGQTEGLLLCGLKSKAYRVSQLTNMVIRILRTA